MNPVTKLCIQNTGAMMWILLTPGTIQRGAPTVFVPQQNECHCGQMCDDPADLAQHVSNDHPPNSVWNCNFCAHNSTKRDYIWKHVLIITISMCTFVNLKIANRAPMAGSMEMMKLLQYGHI